MVHIILAGAVILALIGSMQRSKHIIWIAFMLLFAFAAPRYMFGNDYANYYQIHTRIIHGGYSPYDGEYLFTLLNMLSPTFFVLIAVSSAFFLFGVQRLLLKNLPIRYVWLGVYIFLFNPYLFLMNLSALRQCLAMVCLIFAVEAACRKKLLLYLIMVSVGALFHKSAWLLIPVYILVNDRPVKAWMCWLILAAVLIVVTAVDLDAPLLWVAELFDDPNYLYHVQNDLQNSLRATLLTGIYFIYVLYNLPRLEGRTLVYAKLYLLSTILGILAYKMAMITRVQMYFDIFSVAALPLIFHDVQARGKVIVRPAAPLVTLWDCVNKYAVPVLIVTVYFLRYYSFFTNPMWRSFFEYKTIFSGL